MSHQIVLHSKDFMVLKLTKIVPLCFWPFAPKPTNNMYVLFCHWNDPLVKNIQEIFYDPPFNGFDFQDIFDVKKEGVAKL